MNLRKMLVAAAAACAWVLVHSSPSSADCAREKNPLEGRPFVFNQDCNDVNLWATRGRAQEAIRDWYRRAFAAGAAVFVADVALPDVVEMKDCPSGELMGARFPEAQRKEIRRYQTISELIAQGTDVLHLACEEARKAGVIILGGARMSDAHHGTRWQAKSDDPLFPKIIMEHPEWCNTWQDGKLDATLNYAIPEVQTHRLQILREMATNYSIDGLELNWMRWCRHFPAGRQREHLRELTRFVHQVRIMLDEVARKKGRARMILGHRVPVTLDECLNIGCDVETWAKHGYADFLAPMDFLVNDLNLRTDEFVKAVEGTECLVYPGFGSTNYSLGYLYWDRKGKRRPVAVRSLDQFRATAANWYAWGASGGSCFNMYLWQTKDQDFYSQAMAILSSPKKAFAGSRHYVYLPAWKDVKNFDPTGRHYAQSLTFGADTAGKRQVFTFRMADGRNGERLSGLLRFRIYDATPDDEFAVVLNGRAIPAEKLRIQHQPEGEDLEEPAGSVHRPGETFTWPANLRFDVALADCPPFKGDNKLGITLIKKNRAAKKDPVMEAMEVRVR